MSNFFVSGYLRSGTTLLEKLLCNHPKLSVLSQPFPQLYIEIKREFLKEIGVLEYFTLSNYVLEDRYNHNDFVKYLRKHRLSREFVKSCLDVNYSGQLTQIAPPKHLDDLELFKLYSIYTQHDSHNKLASSFGSKEVLCEEYVKYFVDNGIKVIHIYRDPRDVIASAKRGKGAKYVGKVKPTLFELRNWRKSAQLSLQLSRNPYFLAVQYEDLVTKPFTVLNRITNFLDVSPFDDLTFQNGINDQEGDIWKSNSSFEGTSFISSEAVGRYKRVLTEELVSYIEAICYPEMKLLGMKVEIPSKLNEIITNFREVEDVTDDNFANNYSTSHINVSYEMERSKRFLKGDNVFEFRI